MTAKTLSVACGDSSPRGRAKWGPSETSQKMLIKRVPLLAQALAALPEEDREIFYRFYDLSQTTAQIADELHMNASTVRSRLLRGREALRKTLTKGGLFCEDDVG